MVVSNPGDLMYYGVDASANSFMKLINSKVIDPSLHVGGGFSLDSSYGTLNPGAGLAFWFTDNVGLSLTTYKKIFNDREKMLMAFLMLHFSHTAGLLNLEEKILTVMEYMIKMMRVQTLLV
jgi:hypothetical protein